MAQRRGPAPLAPQRALLLLPRYLPHSCQLQRGPLSHPAQAGWAAGAPQAPTRAHSLPGAGGPRCRAAGQERVGGHRAGDSGKGASSPSWRNRAHSIPVHGKHATRPYFEYSECRAYVTMQWDLSFRPFRWPSAPAAADAPPLSQRQAHLLLHPRCSSALTPRGCPLLRCCAGLLLLLCCAALRWLLPLRRGWPPRALLAGSPALAHPLPHPARPAHPGRVGPPWLPRSAGAARQAARSCAAMGGQLTRPLARRPSLPCPAVRARGPVPPPTGHARLHPATAADRGCPWPPIALHSGATLEEPRWTAVRTPAQASPRAGPARGGSPAGSRCLMAPAWPHCRTVGMAPMLSLLKSKCLCKQRPTLPACDPLRKGRQAAVRAQVACDKLP